MEFHPVMNDHKVIAVQRCLISPPDWTRYKSLIFRLVQRAGRRGARRAAPGGDRLETVHLLRQRDGALVQLPGKRAHAMLQHPLHLDPLRVHSGQNLEFGLVEQSLVAVSLRGDIGKVNVWLLEGNGMKHAGINWTNVYLTLDLNNTELVNATEIKKKTRSLRQTECRLTASVRLGRNSY